MEPITGINRDDARDALHLLVQVQITAQWTQARIEPLAHPALYAALQHVIDAGQEAEDALRQAMPAIAPVGV